MLSKLLYKLAASATASMSKRLKKKSLERDSKTKFNVERGKIH